MMKAMNRRAIVSGLIGTGGILSAISGRSSRADATPQYSPPGNILNFGADPTGVTDSTAAFVAAVAQLWNSDNGCAIYVPSGKYTISQPIELKTKMTIYGDGFTSVIKCNFGPTTAIPNVSNVAAGAVLSYPPMIFNSSPIMWWQIHDLQFDGQHRDAYGAWIASAYYGTLKNVYFIHLEQRPYTAISSNFINHCHIAFYGNGDGVLCSSCMSFSFDTASFERNSGAFSFQWRAPSLGCGPLDMRNIWLENDTTSYNSTGYLGLGGKYIFIRSILGANNSGHNNIRLIHCFDNNDLLSTDNLMMPTVAPAAIDIGQVNDLSNMYYYLGNGAQGNAISGAIHLANILNSSAQPLLSGVGISVNGAIENNTAPNTLTSLTGW